MRKATSTVVLRTSGRMARCSQGDCESSAAHLRSDGRCYFHGKVADGLITGPSLHPIVASRARARERRSA